MFLETAVSLSKVIFRILGDIKEIGCLVNFWLANGKFQKAAPKDLSNMS